MGVFVGSVFSEADNLLTCCCPSLLLHRFANCLAHGTFLHSGSFLKVPGKLGSLQEQALPRLRPVRPYNTALMSHANRFANLICVSTLPLANSDNTDPIGFLLALPSHAVILHST